MDNNELYIHSGDKMLLIPQVATAIIEALPIPIFLFDRDGSLRYANAAGMREFSDILGTPVVFGSNLDALLRQIVKLAVYEDEDGNMLQPADAPVAQAIKQGTVVRKVIKRFVHRTGITQWYVNLGVPIKNEQGLHIWSVSANVDITTQQDDIKSVVASLSLLKEHAAHLNTSLHQHRTLLAQSNNSLSSANENLQQFIHAASHDLREPVRKIRTYTSRLLQDLDGVVPPTAIYHLQRIDHAAHQLVQMIEGVMMYAGVEAQAPVAAMVSLEQVVQQVVASFEVKIQEVGATVIVGALPPVWGVAHLLHQLVANLLSNALTFSHVDTPIRVHITAFRAAENQQDYWVLSVSDNGVGIAAAYREKIFQPFTRLHSKEKQGGAGLGLSICQRILAYHGGLIRVSGNPEGGATFNCYLPDHQAL
ncbi:hypothetical protein BUE76_00630 [Cnuella takakiae]|nr:hypothetical protein BUE76_00630 [Cnuella takakiae]